MTDLQPIDSSYKQQMKPRPHTRAGYHPRNYSTHSSGSFNRQRLKALRNSQLPTRTSSIRNSLNENCEYLHVRLLQKPRICTPQLIGKLQKKFQSQKNDTEPQSFVKQRKMKGLSTARTDKINIQNEETRPMTSNSEKMGYFSDYCSGVEALKCYKILSHIGKGAFSVVSLAVGKQDHRNYAIKSYEKIEALDWNRLASIKREIRHLKHLQHQRVVKLVEVVAQRKKLFLVLENGGKHSLGGLLRKERIISEAKCMTLFKQILEGMTYCHENGVCHRDLKPQNILLDEQGQIKIIDFGFSANSKTMLNNYCGTPAYMSPEIVKKQPYVGAKADIWSLGIILYLMVVGSLPFRAPNEQELNRLIMAGKYRYRDQGSVPLNIRKLIARMLQVNPVQRPSAKDLLGSFVFN